MKNQLSCYWSQSRNCNIELNQYNNIGFILASNDPTRIEVLNRIKKILKEFKIEPILAVEIKENNNLSAFCDNICTYIRGSRIIIADLTAPFEECKYEPCRTLYEEPSVNVYWEYGYAAGLQKQIIIMCEETQAESIPFNILGFQILYYNKDNIEEELGRILKIKLFEKSKMARIERKSRIENIGKTTDSLKEMGKGEMINIIRNTDIEDLIELSENIMETLSYIDKYGEAKENKGLSDFILLLLQSGFEDKDLIEFFEIIFNRFIINVNTEGLREIRNNLKDILLKLPIKKWILNMNKLDDLIELFLASDSWPEAKANRNILYIFKDDLTKEQRFKIGNRAARNSQIIGSWAAKPFVKQLCEDIFMELPGNKRQVIYGEDFEQTLQLFIISKIRITYEALNRLNIEISKEVIKEVKKMPNFGGLLTIEVLNEIPNKKIQDHLNLFSFWD